MTTTVRLNKQRSLWSDALRRLLRDKLAVIGLIFTAVALSCALFAPWIAPYGPVEGDLATLYLKPPSNEHPFGTDDVGRDILSRVIYGAQISMKIAILTNVLGLSLGVTAGLMAGYYGGWVDTVIMRIVDVFFTFPLMIIAITLVAVFGPGETNIFLALSLITWPSIARLVRAQVLSLRETEYVAAARLVGASNFRIMFFHILPNMLTPLTVYITLGLASVILQEAALSFLGLGTADLTTPTWGKMLQQGRSFIRSAPWIPFFPGLAILFTALGFNLLGDGLRDALDVRSR